MRRRLWRSLMAEHAGNIGDVMMMGILVLAMSVIMMSFLNLTQLIQKKGDVRQLSRQYLLEMETKGYLPADSAAQLKKELEEIGAENVSLEGTTLRQVGFGAPIMLEIRGTLGGEYEFTEFRSSTAKY